jgi:hypothetical protein
VARRTADQNRRTDIEEMLIKKGITFTYKPGMDTDQIDQDKSLNNQARLGNPLNAKTVQQYIEALQDGDVFPPLLVHKSRGARYLVVDGNHRLAAHIQAGFNVDAYILEAKNPQVITLLSMTANTKHGLPNSPEERLQHALFMCDNGMSIPEAARAMNVARVELSRAVKKREAERRAAENGILATEWETLPTASRTRLLQVYTDEGFVEAYQLVRDAGLDSAEVVALVSRMNETKSATRQKGVVRAVRLELAERIEQIQVQGRGKKGRQPSSPRQRFAIALGSVQGLPDPTVFLQLDMPEDMRADFCKRTDEAIEQLQQIREALAMAE